MQYITFATEEAFNIWYATMRVAMPTEGEDETT